MRRRNPDLIVPIRDRRRRRRYLTLKNIGIVSAVLIVLFIVISVRSEWRGKTADTEYGRLYGKEMTTTSDLARKPVEPVTEAPVDDQQSADPFALAAARREQYLNVTPQETATTQTGQQATAIAPPAPPVLGHSDRRVTISGGPEGVGVAVDTRGDVPKLGGGFGKP